MAFLITYIPQKSLRVNERLINRVKEYSNWAILSSNNYIVNDDTTDAVQIRNELGNFMENADKMIVTELTGRAAWRNFDDEISRWIKQNL